MTKQGNKDWNEKFLQEYEQFLKQHLFPLLGIVNKNIEQDILTSSAFTSTVTQDDKYLYFGVKGCRLFKLEYPHKVPEDNIRLARLIIQRFFNVAEYKRTGSAKNNYYFSETQRATVHSMAVQKGICDWIAWIPGTKKVDEDGGTQIEKLFGKLEKWSVKTYEGKNVTLGFVIDPTVSLDISNEYGTWLDFLDDDSSSLLTDCIHSVIELDAHCNLLGYKSISENEEISACELQQEIPLRFMHVVQKFVTDKKVGVFLLNNGDIILAKRQRICFVKRNLRWLNMSYEAFENALEVFVKENEEIGTQEFYCLLKNVFASVLDVSFSHAGGIVAVVGGDLWKETIARGFDKNSLLDPCDNLLNGESCESLKEIKMRGTEDFPEHERQLKEKEINKRLQKRTVLLSLIQEKKFTAMDRKLRSELIGLDGACILDFSGKVYSYGAIIQNDSGSTGGGRGAAAKKLSRYGLAVKISTDGYIELYVNSECVYEIK